MTQVTNPMRVAIVGAGAFGRQHLDVLRGLEGVRVTSVADHDRGRAEDAAEAAGGAHVPRHLDEVLSSDEVDAVVLATPTPDHAELAIRTMRTGRAVLVEIPVADKLGEGTGGRECAA